MEYADLETVVAEWLHGVTGYQTWIDPVLPTDFDFATPLGHVQRGPGEGDTALTLDSAILDIDWLCHDADLARSLGEKTRGAIRLVLPLMSFNDGATFITGTSTLTAPFWAPAVGVHRRSASYRVIAHGMVT